MCAVSLSSFSPAPFLCSWLPSLAASVCVLLSPFFSFPGGRKKDDRDPLSTSSSPSPLFSDERNLMKGRKRMRTEVGDEGRVGRAIQQCGGHWDLGCPVRRTVVVGWGAVCTQPQVLSMNARKS